MNLTKRTELRRIPARRFSRLANDQPYSVEQMRLGIYVYGIASVVAGILDLIRDSIRRLTYLVFEFPYISVCWVDSAHNSSCPPQEHSSTRPWQRTVRRGRERFLSLAGYSESAQSTSALRILLTLRTSP